MQNSQIQQQKKILLQNGQKYPNRDFLKFNV